MSVRDPSGVIVDTPVTRSRGIEVAPQVYADLTVAKVAVALTYEEYDNVMQNNVLWNGWKRIHPGKSAKALERLFVRKHAHRMLPAARATLARLLKSHINEDLKNEIASALIRDNSLRRGRNRIVGGNVC